MSVVPSSLEVVSAPLDTPVLSIAEFYELVTGVLEQNFGRRQPQWVRGEIAKVFEKGHMYIDLVDANGSDAKPPMLGAHCWQSGWAKIKQQLAMDGVSLKPGMVVNLKGFVDVYAPQGKIGFTIQEVDIEGLLGDVAKRRAALIEALRKEGLFEKNKASTLSPVPLRVGLIASKGTEGFSDFTGQLLNSGFSFVISHVQTLVQGEQAPQQMVTALQYLENQELDLIALVRGGGSKGDLACFDDEQLARAIAGCSKPVFTGIGHTGDESIADLVAFHRAITPTKLGEEIAGIVSRWHEATVLENLQSLTRSAADLIDEETSYLAERRRTVVFAVRDRLKGESRQLANIAQRLSLATKNIMAKQTQKLETARQLLQAYDPARRLRQGWSITSTSSGAVVTSITELNEGDAITTRFADGSVSSTVTKKVKQA
jgi:exodeoxyribonuclease VII large subunit